MQDNIRFVFAVFSALLASSALGAAYTDHANGYAVTPPNGWHRVTDPRTAALFSGPTTPDGVTPNINVIVKTLPGALSLDEASRMSGEGIAATFPGSRAANTYKGTLGGQPAISTVYLLPVKGRTVVSIQTIALFGNRVYVLTGTTSQSNSKAFGPLNTAFIQNFHFLK